MKKIIILIAAVILVAAFVIFSQSRTAEENLNSILNMMSIEFGDIEYIMVLDEQGEFIQITKSSDFSFLKDYVYSGEYDELSELFLFPKTKRAQIVLKEEERQIYILETGEIVDDSYRLYSSDKLLDSKSLIELLKKYGSDMD